MVLETSFWDAAGGAAIGSVSTAADEAHSHNPAFHDAELWPSTECPRSSWPNCKSPCTWNYDTAKCEYDCTQKLTNEQCELYTDCTWVKAENSGGKYNMDTCQQRCGTIPKQSHCTAEPDCYWKGDEKHGKCVPLQLDSPPFVAPIFHGDLKDRFDTCIQPQQGHDGAAIFRNLVDTECRNNKTVRCIKHALQKTPYFPLWRDAINDGKCLNIIEHGSNPATEDEKYTTCREHIVSVPRFHQVAEDARKSHCFFSICMDREKGRLQATVDMFEKKIEGELKQHMKEEQYFTAREFLGTLKKNVICDGDIARIKHSPPDKLDSTRECREMVDRCEKFSDKIDGVMRGKFIYKYLLSLADKCSPLGEQECHDAQNCEYEYGRCKSTPVPKKPEYFSWKDTRNANERLEDRLPLVDEKMKLIQ